MPPGAYLTGCVDTNGGGIPVDPARNLWRHRCYTNSHTHGNAYRYRDAYSYARLHAHRNYALS